MWIIENNINAEYIHYRSKVWKQLEICKETQSKTKSDRVIEYYIHYDDSN